MNFARLGYVAERAAVGEHREAIFAVTIPERPGAFLAFCAALGDAQRHRVQLPARVARRGAHLRRRRGREAAPRRARIADGPRAARLRVRRPLRGRRREDAHPPHGRRPHVPEVRDEVLYDFEFPERPGALLQFLTSLGIALEHLALPLPQPRRRVRPRALRPRGAAGRAATSCARGSTAIGFRARRGDRQPGRPLLPALSEDARLAHRNGRTTPRCGPAGRALHHARRACSRRRSSRRMVPLRRRTDGPRLVVLSRRLHGEGPLSPAVQRCGRLYAEPGRLRARGGGLPPSHDGGGAVRHRVRASIFSGAQALRRGAFWHPVKLADDLYEIGEAFRDAQATTRSPGQGTSHGAREARGMRAASA